MPDSDNNDRRMALGAAMARQMMREDGREAERVRRTQPSTMASLATIAFVFAVAVGMLVAMIIFA